MNPQADALAQSDSLWQISEDSLCPQYSDKE